MLLQQLCDFEWLNDPFDVSFENQRMRVIAKPRSDFWQNVFHKIDFDNGHFFYANKQDNFTLEVKWCFDEIDTLSQCGAMLRIDAKNWFKVSIMLENNQQLKIGCSLTQGGISDWSTWSVPEGTKEIWYKIKRTGNDFAAYYSLDGEKYAQVRLFGFIEKSKSIKAGAYICCPMTEGFTAKLETSTFA